MKGLRMGFFPKNVKLSRSALQPITFICPLIHPLIYLSIHLIFHKFTHFSPFIHSPIHSLTHSLSHPLTHSPTHSLTHSLIHSPPTHSPTHTRTEALRRVAAKESVGAAGGVGGLAQQDAGHADRGGEVQGGGMPWL